MENGVFPLSCKHECWDDVLAALGVGENSTNMNVASAPPKRNGMEGLFHLLLFQRKTKKTAEAPKVEAEIPHSAQKRFSEFLSFLPFAPS